MPNWTSAKKKLLAAAAALALAIGLTTPLTAQNASASSERWLHVSVVSQHPKGERVRVNLPISIAESVLTSVKHEHLDHEL
jgi:hypothetical protein